MAARKTSRAFLGLVSTVSPPQVSINQCVILRRESGKSPRNFGASRKFPAAVELSVEPDAGVSPVLVRGCAREAEQLRGLLDGQAGEIAEFDQLAGLGFLGGEG